MSVHIIETVILYEKARNTLLSMYVTCTDIRQVWTCQCAASFPNFPERCLPKHFQLQCTGLERFWIQQKPQIAETSSTKPVDPKPDSKSQSPQNIKPMHIP